MLVNRRLRGLIGGGSVLWLWGLVCVYQGDQGTPSRRWFFHSLMRELTKLCPFLHCIPAYIARLYWAVCFAKSMEQGGGSESSPQIQHIDSYLTKPNYYLFHTSQNVFVLIACNAVKSVITQGVWCYLETKYSSIVTLI